MLDLCEVPNKAEVSNEIIVDNDDVSINYDSDQSIFGSSQTSEGEEHWDTDMEEILQDLEMSDELLVIGTSLNIIFLITLGIVLWSVGNSIKLFNQIPALQPCSPIHM